LEEDPVEGKTASVSVPDDQLSLAIGRAGQNARLAAKLTGWRSDIQGVTEAATWALQQVNQDPNVLPALGPIAELLPSAANILRQHEQEALPYSSEELLTMRQVIEGVRGYYASLRNAERARRLEEELARRAAIEAAEAQRRATIEAALALIPPQAREVPLGHLENAGLETVWDILERSAEGDEGLLKMEGIGPKSLAEIKECIDALALPKAEQVAVAEEAVAEIAAPETEVAPPAEEGPVSVAKEVVEEAAAEVEPEPAAEAAEEEGVVKKPVVKPVEIEEVPEIAFEEDEIDIFADKKPRKKGRRKRELVYDEDLGEVVALRRRKRGGEGVDEISEWEEILG
jgi:N utilization substance protein A